MSSGRLETAATDDVVVVALSGHGSETHELVAYDTDPYDISGTSIPLTTLGEWCARIPCRRLLIVLDCCFSGGMGAKRNLPAFGIVELPLWPNPHRERRTPKATCL